MHVVASQRGATRNAAMVLWGSSSAVIAVSLIIKVRFVDQLAQSLGRIVPARKKAIEELVCGEDHLVRRLASTALPPMPSASTATHSQPRLWLGISTWSLLVGAVTAMQCSRRDQPVGSYRGSQPWRQTINSCCPVMRGAGNQGFP